MDKKETPENKSKYRSRSIKNLLSPAPIVPIQTADILQFKPRVHSKIPAVLVEGPMKCIRPECEHEWESIIDTSIESAFDAHECPKCGMDTGVFSATISDPSAQLCGCGCDLYRVVASEEYSDTFEPMCIMCGSILYLD